MIAENDTPAFRLRAKVNAGVSLSAIMAWFGMAATASHNRTEHPIRACYLTRQVDTNT
jgi:hypothetical protein